MINRKKTYNVYLQRMHTHCTCIKSITLIPLFSTSTLSEIKILKHTSIVYPKGCLPFKLYAYRATGFCILSTNYFTNPVKHSNTCQKSKNNNHLFIQFNVWFRRIVLCTVAAITREHSVILISYTWSFLKIDFTYFKLSF